MNFFQRRFWFKEVLLKRFISSKCLKNILTISLSFFKRQFYILDVSVRSWWNNILLNLTCAIWINRWLQLINYCWWSTVKRKLVYKYLFNYSGSKYLLSSIYFSSVLASSILPEIQDSSVLHFRKQWTQKSTSENSEYSPTRLYNIRVCETSLTPTFHLRYILIELKKLKQMITNKSNQLSFFSLHQFAI